MSGTQTPDLTLAMTLDEFIGNYNPGTGMQTVRATKASVANELALLIGQAGGITLETWTALSGITGASDGVGANVIGDGGNHTDPVTGATVENSGIYRWVSATPGWKWLSDNSIAAVTQTANRATPSAGEFAPEVISYCASSAINGASLIASSNGDETIGLSIPSGSTGAGSYLIYYPPLPPSEIAALAGKTIRLISVFETTAGFLSQKGAASSPAVNLNRNLATNGGTQISATQVGTVLTVVVEYAIVGTETSIGAIFEVDPSATALGVNHTAQLSSFSWSIVGDATAVGPGGRTNAALVNHRAASRFSVGSIYDELSPSLGNVYNSVSFLTDPVGQTIGWSIPAGTLGNSGANSTNLYYIYDIPAEDKALYRSRTVRVRLSIDTSSGYSRRITPSMFCQVLSPFSSSAAANFLIVQNKQVSATRRVITLQGDIASTTDRLAINILNGSGGGAGDMTTATTDTVALSDIDIEIVGTPSDWLTTTDEVERLVYNRALRDARLVTVGSKGRAGGSRIIVASSGGDFSTIADGIAALTRNAQLIVKPGVYAEAQWYRDIDDVFMTGYGPSRSIARNYQADTTSLTQITNDSAAFIRRAWVVSGMRFEIKNGRYAVHDDSSDIYKNKKIVFEDCDFEHFGNDGAYAYQVSLGGGGNPAGVWQNNAAYGLGISSGSERVFTRCSFKGYKYQAFYGHDWPSDVAPSRLSYTNCSFDPQSTTTSVPCFSWENHGPGYQTSIQFHGCEFNGPIQFGGAFWSDGVTAADQNADRAGFTVTGAGNTPAVAIIADDGARALRIDSATTGTSSSVTISGTAASVLFGSVVTVAGDVGLAGGAYGTWDIAEHGVGPSGSAFITSLGYRLGDCSSVNKTLTVTIDGGSPINIVFSTNLTATSNATILSTINTALGAAGTASAFNVTDLFRPRFMDEEVVLLNTDTTTILRKTAVKYDSATSRAGKIMTSSDAASTFAGVALEDIRPGASGRVKTRGALRVSQDILRSDGSGSFSAGATFGVGATAGKFVASPSIALFQATDASDVRFLATTRVFAA